jgi:hypothetical protein
VENISLNLIHPVTPAKDPKERGIFRAKEVVFNNYLSQESGLYQMVNFLVKKKMSGTTRDKQVYKITSGGLLAELGTKSDKLE